MGSGKTAVGRELSRILGWDFVDLDEAVAAREGLPVSRMIAEKSEDAFRVAELAALREILRRAEDDLVLSLGGGTVTIPEAAALVFSRTRSVWLRADIKTIRRRIGPDLSSRPLFDESLLALREPMYSGAELHLDTDGRTPESVAREIVSSFQA